MKQKPSDKLREVAEKWEHSSWLLNPSPGNKEAFSRYATEEVGKAVLRERTSLLDSPLHDLKSDDIKDKGLRRLEKPVKRKRSSVYKLGK